MVNIRRTIRISVLFGTVVLAAPAFAYGPVGHQIVCAIADEKLAGTPAGAKVSEYLDGVRELEQRIGKIEGQQSAAALDLPPLPVGIPDLFEDHVKLMCDLQVLAFTTDITRVSTFLPSPILSQSISNKSGKPFAICAAAKASPLRPRQ